MADLFNLSFTTGVFPSVLKTAKVVPVFKKDSKLDYSNCCPISLLSNIEKILEKLIYKRLYTLLLAKLNHYAICGVSNDCFKSYLSNHNQYVSINEYKSGLAALNCGVLPGSVLGPLLFLLYINDFNQAIKFCKVNHFADDTDLLCLSNSIKKLNKLNGINWTEKTELDALFHCIAYDYFHADWDGLRDHFRDVPWENIFKLGASAAASEFCDWF